ncbi:DegT/DnrJ/EryC1/StrS family aminotransferase [Candidatus Bathyarchaeota archaeon]|nr:DegT/DnrJ/EryC1/StrS family aminotransferase [Candidatus Bathyarchaeota archaeon]
MNRKISIAKPNFGQEEEDAVKEVLNSGILASGPKTKAFEKEYAEYIGVEHAVALTNGTVALDVALKALKIGSGDEVITSAFSFVASGNCILFQNAKPVFADIDPKTFNIDPSDVAEKITAKTKALIPIHMFGQPANMDALKEIAEDKGIVLVEDAAQAHGAEYNGQKAGSIGNMGCFSFYATKNMTAGEGGMITTNDPKLADNARLLINHGQSRKYHHDTLGYNYRMTEICAAIGSVQLRKLDGFNAKRIDNAALLSNGIRKLDGLTVPQVDKDSKHVFHQYVIRVEDNYPLDRDEFAEFLAEKGVGAAVHYPIPIYRQPLYMELGYGGTVCPNTEDACRQVLSLPVHPLVNKPDIEYILDILKAISQQR